MIKPKTKKIKNKIKKVKLIVINALRLSVLRRPRGACEDIRRRSAGVF